MWENETVVLVTTLKKRLMGGADRFHFKRIVNDDAVPAFIKQIFEDRILRYVTTEKPLQIRKTPHFDLTANEAQDWSSEFKEAIYDAAVFPPEEVQEVLQEALVFRLDFLLKPVDTMRRRLFENGDALSVDEADERLTALKKILPYPDRFLEGCRTRGMDEIHRDRYGEVSAEMMHAMMDEDAVQLVMRDYSILTDFLSETKGEEVGRIEGTLLQNFLADRNAWGFRRALDVEMKLGREDFSAVELELTLKRYQELREEFSEKGAPVSKADEVVDTAPPAEEPAESGTAAEEWQIGESFGEEELFVADGDEQAKDAPGKPGIAADAGPEDDGIGALAEALQEEPAEEPEEEPAEEPEEEPEEELAEEPAEEPEPDEEKPKPMKILRKEKKQDAKEEAGEDRGQSEEMKPEPKEDGSRGNGGFRELLDEKTEKTFVKKLFGGDKSAYDELLGRLEESESWRVAKILIDNELFKRDVDPFSREAIKLVDMVYSLYYPEEGVGGK